MKLKEKHNFIIITSIFPPDRGGPASFVPEFCEFLLNKKQNLIAVITFSDNLLNDDKIYSFPIIRILRHQNKLLRFIKTVNLIYKYSRKANIVFANGLVLETIIATKIFSRKKVGIKVVGDLIWEKFHSKSNDIDFVLFQKKDLGFKFNFLRELQKLYLNQADIILTPSKFMAKVICNWEINQKKIIVVPNGVSILNKPKLEFNKKIYDVIVIGRLIPLKRFDKVIKVCAENNYCLRIVGDGPENFKLQEQVRNLNVGNIITFSGSISRRKTLTEISKSRILVLYSIHENSPHVILESQLLSVPVISTNVGGVSEIISNMYNGILVDKYDLNQLKIAIKNLLSNPDLRNKITQNAKENLENQFNFEKTSEMTFNSLIRLNQKS